MLPLPLLGHRILLSAVPPEKWSCTFGVTSLLWMNRNCVHVKLKCVCVSVKAECNTVDYV